MSATSGSAAIDIRHGASGAQQKLERGKLFQDRDYPVLNDYRAVLGGLFRGMWGLSPKQSGTIFQQVAPVDLKLVCRRTIYVNCGIVREDFGICQGTQENYASGGYSPGPLSPRHESSVVYFQGLVRSALGATA